MRAIWRLLQIEEFLPTPYSSTVQDSLSVGVNPNTTTVQPKWMTTNKRKISINEWAYSNFTMLDSGFVFPFFTRG
jgi:hypothetical protein